MKSIQNACFINNRTSCKLQKAKTKVSNTASAEFWIIFPVTTEAIREQFTS
jgi:hypothetical protein